MRRLDDIMRNYPDTGAAKEAETLKQQLSEK
jgi:hypothetical protein